MYRMILQRHLEEIRKILEDKSVDDTQLKNKMLMEESRYQEAFILIWAEETRKEKIVH